jgi:hypothetical protein
MATNRSFAYNSGSVVPGTTQVGFIAAGLSGPIKYNESIAWWAGPDEDLGYVICHTSGARTAAQGTISVDSPTIGFWRSALKTDVSFLSLCNGLFNQGFINTGAAVSWLNSNGYWTSYTPVTLAGSLLFNGSNQSLSISPGVTFGAGAYTVEGWFYNNSSFNNKGIMGSPVTSPTGCLNLYFANNTTITSDRNGGGGSFSYTMASAISLNAWHYFIYNRNANGVTAVYIDGVRCTSTFTDTLNYTTATDMIGRYYGGYWPGYWTNMRLNVGSAVYNSSLTTQTNPTAELTSSANTKYLMLGAVVTTDSSGTQTVTNNNGVTQSGVQKPF